MIDVFGPYVREGDLLGVSDWKCVTQETINLFARATDDFQFFHVDPVRAARETPFGGTIAHGFLTLSLVSLLALDALPTPEALKSAVVVAVDRIRFSAPVPAGRRIRGSFYFKRSSRIAENSVLLRAMCKIEIEGGDRPVLSGEFSWLCTLRAAGEVACPGEATRTARPLEAVQRSQPFEAVQRSQPLEAAQISRPLEAAQVSRPLEAAQVSRPLEAAQVSRPLEAAVAM